MPDQLENQYQSLKEILGQMDRVLVAYSGGVDSTFLLKVALDTLGSERVLAVTALSSTYPEEQAREAREVAAMIGARHKEIISEELEIKHFADNPPNRCYYCKSELFARLVDLARQEGLPFVADGTNAGDAADYRPGRQAAMEKGIRSPLQEAGLTKKEIRELSRELNLPTWNKPAMACLASRIPYGERITGEKLKQVDRAETCLKELGVEPVRVRNHGGIARIETDPGLFSLLVAKGPQIGSALKRMGFDYVTLDLEGYRSGSLNEVLAKELPAREQRD